MISHVSRPVYLDWRPLIIIKSSHLPQIKCVTVRNVSCDAGYKLIPWVSIFQPVHPTALVVWMVEVPVRTVLVVTLAMNYWQLKHVQVGDSKR